MLGMSLSTFTLVHVVLSLVGICSGIVVVYGLLAGKRLDGWTGLFLVTTAATSLTGFGFPFDHLLPFPYRRHHIDGSAGSCLAAQLVVLTLFAVLSILAVKKFRIQPAVVS